MAEDRDAISGGKVVDVEAQAGTYLFNGFGFWLSELSPVRTMTMR
jgi:hypothetical protein